MSFINNKKFQPVLILLVLSLWVYIGYKVYQSMSADDDTLEPVSLSRITRLSEASNQEIWTSQFDFRDPFVHRVEKKRRVQKKTPVQKKSKVEKPIFRLDLKFSGLIKDSNQDKQLAMLIYQGKTVLADQGLEIGGYTLTKITTDSVMFVDSEYQYIVRR